MYKPQKQHSIHRRFISFEHVNKVEVSLLKNFDLALLIKEKIVTFSRLNIE